jgi:hypothetical protein
MKRLLLLSLIVALSNTAHGCDCWKAFKNKIRSWTHSRQVAPAPAGRPAPMPVLVAPVVDQRDLLAQELAAQFPVEYTRAILEMDAAKKRYPQG